MCLSSGGLTTEEWPIGPTELDLARPRGALNTSQDFLTYAKSILDEELDFFEGEHFGS